MGGIKGRFPPEQHKKQEHNMKMYIVKMIDSKDHTCAYVVHAGLKSAREHVEHLNELGIEAHIRLAAKNRLTHGLATHEADESDWAAASEIPARK